MPDYAFKTLYFPAPRTRAGKPARVTISIPLASNRGHHETATLRRLSEMSGSQIIQLLGDPILDDLEAKARAEDRSLSNTVLKSLLAQGRSLNWVATPTSANGDDQLDLFEAKPSALGERAYGVTFRESNRRPLHGWYPYVEGFSAHYVEDVLTRYGGPRDNVFDPFGGAGTTQLAAASLGVPSYYCELNPFMVFVTRTKTQAASWARSHLAEFRAAALGFFEGLAASSFAARCRRIDLTPYHSAFPDRDFFVETHLRLLLGARDLARSVTADPHARDILVLACAANTVAVSNMTRRADLRRRRSDEYKTRIVDVTGAIGRTVRLMLADVEQLPQTMAPALFVCDDAKQLPAAFAEQFAMSVTSPPYLNGTNYFRNTKLELWLLGLISVERDLQPFRARAVCGGINDVTGPRPEPRRFGEVEAIAAKLDQSTKDRRIPAMVRHYFSDMHAVFVSTLQGLRPGSRFVMDIGDSCFYGVHVPTDRLLAEVGRDAGFELEDRHVLAKRYSKDRTQLHQVELVFRKPPERRRIIRSSRRQAELRQAIAEFSAALPYLNEPYTKRNWGHPLHSLCSYQGKLKPAIAHWLIRRFAPSGEAVLDPLGGVGTIAFEAALSGHQAVSNDKSPFAAIVAAGKLGPPNQAEALAAVDQVAGMMSTVHLTRADFHAAEFGLNAAVKDYYHPGTLEEVLKARRVYLSRPEWAHPFPFVWAALLHILHGNRPYAISRRSHPITPFSPTGPAPYRALIPKLVDRVALALSTPLPREFRPGIALRGDFRDLPERAAGPFGAVITSPPFMGMRFDRPNWLRLWFCGWDESDFHTTSLGFLERQQVTSTDCYARLFATCERVLRPGGVVLIHVGSGNRDTMHEALVHLGGERLQFVGNAKEDVTAVEKHGISDKGRTTHHHYLFFLNG